MCIFKLLMLHFIFLMLQHIRFFVLLIIQTENVPCASRVRHTSEYEMSNMSSCFLKTNPTVQGHSPVGLFHYFLAIKLILLFPNSTSRRTILIVLGKFVECLVFIMAIFNVRLHIVWYKILSLIVFIISIADHFKFRSQLLDFNVSNYIKIQPS